jgi:TctA family transporter
MIFLLRPISATLMAVSLFLLAYPLIPRIGKRRNPLAQENKDD